MTTGSGTITAISSTVYATVAEFKAFTAIDSTDATDDTVITNILDASSRFIDNHTRRTFYARTETHYYDVPSGNTLYIEDDDLISITTLTNGDTTVLTTSDYVLLPNNGSPKYAIKLKTSSTNSWEEDTNGDSEKAITLLGTWGWAADCPTDIKEACLEISASYYHHRYGENMSSETTITAGGVVITPKDIPASARSILDNYLRYA